jgi:CRISPR/Cas system CMR-associated protein Cmr5 small subunit
MELTIRLPEARKHNRQPFGNVIEHVSNLITENVSANDARFFKVVVESTVSNIKRSLENNWAYRTTNISFQKI